MVAHHHPRATRRSPRLPSDRRPQGHCRSQSGCRSRSLAASSWSHPRHPAHRSRPGDNRHGRQVGTAVAVRDGVLECQRPRLRCPESRTGRWGPREVAACLIVMTAPDGKVMVVMPSHHLATDHSLTVSSSPSGSLSFDQTRCPTTGSPDVIVLEIILGYRRIVHARHQIVTVASSVPPLPSEMVYVKVSTPSSPCRASRTGRWDRTCSLRPC